MSVPPTTTKSPLTTILDEAKHRIIVIGKSDCKWCTYSKEVLTELHLSFTYIPIDDKDARDTIKASANMKTVPIIYIDKELIGGYNDLVSILSDKKAFDVKYPNLMQLPSIEIQKK